VVTIKIFDLMGREVATVLENVELPAGRHQRLWDGRDAQGRAVVSGIYFYRLVVGSFTKTMKMAVMR
jgi:flagellar hook assembly protein FlgD